MARDCLIRAKAELETGEDHRLRYAALELRMAMEQITYDRAYQWREDIPESEYDVWKPAQILQALIDVDPQADQDVTVAFAPENSDGETVSYTHLTLPTKA